MSAPQALLGGFAVNPWLGLVPAFVLEQLEAAAQSIRARRRQ